MTCELKRNLMELLLLYRSQELKEALRAQMEVQRRLHEQGGNYEFQLYFVFSCKSFNSMVALAHLIIMR